MTTLRVGIASSEELDLDAMALEEAKRPLEEGGRARLLLVG